MGLAYKKAVMLSMLGCAAFSSSLMASSHREAPFIAGSPKVDGTDFYMFRSYEAGREGFVTLIANYQPLQDAYGGPNYFTMDPQALYEIHIDNDGDAIEDLTFQFQFANAYGQASAAGLIDAGKVKTGEDDQGNDILVQVPLAAVGGGSGTSTGLLNVVESFSVELVAGPRRSGNATPVSNLADGSTSFAKPVDNIGNKTIPDYEGYASQFVYDINIPGCMSPGKMFVGQRQEGFVVNLGQVFDQVNLNPLGARDSASNTIADKNVTSLALELPISCVTAGSETVIGAWTTASKPQARLLNSKPVGPTASADGQGPSVEGGAWTQVSRLGSPLVNEVVIGITDKDKFNASHPKDDVENFGAYVLYPTLPVLVDVLFPGATVVPDTPRSDLLAAFVTGVNGLNQAAAAQPGEMLRLNTAIAPTALVSQGELGFLDCDLAGFPNGRRPVDDVVDIALSVAEGAITAANPNGLQTCDLSGAAPAVVNAGAVVNDGAKPDRFDYLGGFPYLATPIAGSP
ncbi:DUF4331 domain-containing protein [Spongiibacter marinus]|uniref:DUF4331 domain-containing protein n=1 Tax=Spongiibacter marinus TaxID=354246 RepID=UPI0019600ED3|nr:DUF4331 domain-containing protein [Spongiibacter marinus]MBM7424029.1 hypothetical protein [Spongiibacter marinus]